ncbi:MAG: DUF2971 domain-containing protein [Bacillota bacterium]
MVDMEEVYRYREEHPMDYIKVLELLNKFSKEPEIFNDIYKVIKIHVPDIIYKYYSLTDDMELNSIKFQTLSNKEIFLSFSEDFNDPFDNKSFYYDIDSLKNYRFSYLFGEEFIEEHIKSSRFASFSSAGSNNLPMWAHYSNNHHGFCVSYSTNFEDNPELSPQVFPIQYAEDRVDITQYLISFLEDVDDEYNEAQKNGNDEIVLSNLMVLWLKIFMGFIKEKRWEHEKEFRVQKPNNTINPHKMKANPKVIYIGQKCKDEYKMKLINIAFQLNIPIYQMEMNLNLKTYELETKQISI